MTTEARKNALRLVTSNPAPRRPKHEVTVRLTAEEFDTLSALARNRGETREEAIAWMLSAAAPLLEAEDEGAVLVTP